MKASSGSESFQYFEVEHTLAPLASNLGPLLETGYAELDFTLSLIPTKEGHRARDHGYLFKMWDTHRNLLFPPPKTYSLLT